MKYLTVARAGEANFTEKRSRFIGFAYPAASVGEAKERMAELQRRYCDARHVCWAWVIGVESPESYSTDNGEPSGTAGKPILGQINSRGLRNVVVGVVRYFGGIKLGTPGLIAAYRLAASMALDEAGSEEREEMTELQFTFGYADMNAVMQLIKADGIAILDRTFDNTCSLRIALPKTQAEALQPRLATIKTVQI
ncbi:MAG: IMPACT family protein [Bacteroides sp.]|nr:IMPACT family protein [Bacteroides sp.]MCM1378984.1 IMPACT family protein [Bacteroides sp.]MCM1445600.1 IMPACT family protein [Prevotella sp.]